MKVFHILLLVLLVGTSICAKSDRAKPTGKSILERGITELVKIMKTFETAKSGLADLQPCTCQEDCGTDNKRLCIYGFCRVIW